MSLTSAVTSLGRLSLMAKCEVGTYCGVFRRQALDRGVEGRLRLVQVVLREQREAVRIDDLRHVRLLVD